MTAPRDTLFRRSLRRLTLGSGPLKRRSDRIEVIGRLAVVLSFLVAPLLAVVASTATTAHLQAAAAAQAAERSRTHAVVLVDAPGPLRPGGDAYGVPSTDDPSPSVVPVRAAWSAPGGISREGVVLVEPRTPVGTAVPVWVDGEGRLTSAPLDQASISVSATAMGLLPLIGVPLATWTLHVFLAIALDNRRERAWEDEWAAVEPDWNSRLL
ncbi:Rv1733c family protein [Geodermatophilus sp. CPCC 205761]|uniref:Rv1733c family protein n=1 Tax=Geodermatophilus sp. CPCC 205761 TaxID=2936597 RepID=UPI003EE977B1